MHQERVTIQVSISLNEAKPYGVCSLTMMLLKQKLMTKGYLENL